MQGLLCSFWQAPIVLVMGIYHPQTDQARCRHTEARANELAEMVKKML